MRDLSFLTVSEFKAFKKAQRILLSVGIDRDSATEMILAGILKTRHNPNHREPIRVAR